MQKHEKRADTYILNNAMRYKLTKDQKQIIFWAIRLFYSKAWIWVSFFSKYGHLKENSGMDMKPKPEILKIMNFHKKLEACEQL